MQLTRSVFQLCVKRSAAAGTGERIDRALPTSFTTGSASSAGRLTTDFPPPQGRGEVYGQPWKSMWTVPYRQHPLAYLQIGSGFPRFLYLPERKKGFIFCAERRSDSVWIAAQMNPSSKRNRAKGALPICSELHTVLAVWSTLPHVPS